MLHFILTRLISQDTDVVSHIFACTIDHSSVTLYSFLLNTENPWTITILMGAEWVRSGEQVNAKRYWRNIDHQNKILLFISIALQSTVSTYLNCFSM